MSNDGTDLALRQRVATFDGYHDFTTHIPQNRISAREDVGGRFVEIPYYELSFDAIAEACDRQGINPDIMVYGERHKARFVDRCGAVYEDIDGDTRAIALCYLFITVMESRLAKNNFSAESQKLSIREELVKIETPFTRSLLKQIREKAFQQSLSQSGCNVGSVWIGAFNDLAISADRLDAMLARKEWAKNEYGGTEKE